MKKLIFIASILLAVQTSFAQVRGFYKTKYYFDADLKTGIVKQKFNSIPFTANYTEAVNAVDGKMTYNNTGTLGYHLQLGRYLDKRNRLSIEAGVMTFIQQGFIKLDTFHVEYKAYDYKDNVFRQVLNARDGIEESIKSTNVNIPVLLRYSIPVSDMLSVSAEAGGIFNTTMTSTYSSDASFDYEAIYQFKGAGANPETVYDNSPKPMPQDWLITRNEFYKDNPKGNISNYFDDLRTIGYNVALDQGVKKNTGEVHFLQKSLGYMGQLNLHIKAGPQFVMRFGGYFISQTFSNTAKNSHYLLTNKIGDYHSLLSFTKDMRTINYGLSFGFSYLFKSYANYEYDRTFNESIR